MKKLALVLAAALVVAPAGAATTKRVKVTDGGFSPKSVSIKKGDSVKWVWTGSHRHWVFQTDGPGHFHSPTQKKGSFVHKFKKTGTYRFICTYEENMTMTVKVTR